MRTAHVHVAKLTPAQQQLAEDVGPWARACRDVWNAALQERLEALRVARGRTIPKGWWPTYASQCRGLTDAKKVAPWLAEAPHHVLQQTLKDLDTAWGAWLYERRAGRPRFRARKRSARNWWAPSYRFPDRKQFTIRRLNRRWGDATLPKIGPVRFRWDRDLPDDAQVTNVTLKRDRVGDWTVAFALDIPDVEVAHPNPGTVVGVDRGVTVLAATSDGQLLDRNIIDPDGRLGPDLLTNGERTRLSRLERRKARQKRGSKNQARTRRQIATLKRRQARRRGDLAHKISARLAAGYETVAVEQLDVAAMMASARGTVDKPGTRVAQKRGLNRSIASKGWGMLHGQLAYKTARHGGRRPVAKAAYTSQTCHVCSHIDPVSRENQARWVCVACSHRCHADVNAAINVLARAVPAGQAPRKGPAAGHAVAACQALQTSVGASKQEPAPRPRARQAA